MNLFVFGTLLIDDIVMALLGTVPQRACATLHGYRRGNIVIPGRIGKGPAILASAHSQVAGDVLMDLTPAQVQVLDLFESVSPGYQRVEGSVETASGGPCVASFYASTSEIAEFVSAEDWTIHAFKRDYLEDYVTRRIPTLLADWEAKGLVG